MTPNENQQVQKIDGKIAKKKKNVKNNKKKLTMKEYKIKTLQMKKNQYK